MADIQLNKPLYKDPDTEFVPPTPRGPKSSLLNRGAAFFLDFMLLWFVFSVIVRFAPTPVLALGPLAPWVGLLLGWAYFTVGFSSLTLGRTIGKLITRVQVADIAGPDLSLGRAGLRAFGLLWPLAVRLLLSLIAEHYSNTDPVSIFITVEVFGLMLVLGWVIGNLVFAAMDPAGRTVYDRAAGSVVINAELEPSVAAEYLAAVRDAAAYPPPRRAVTALGIALAGCLAFAAASSVQVMRQLRDITPEERDRAWSMVHEPYGRAWPMPPADDDMTTGILPANFDFRKRGFLSLDTIKNDPQLTGTLDKIIAGAMGPGFAEELKQYLASADFDKARRGEKPTSAPTTVRFQVSFAEYADLFFASEGHRVYSLSRDVPLPTTLTETLAEPPAQPPAESRE